MTDPVSERPTLSQTLDGMVRALYRELSAHAVRSNLTVPKDGSELITMQALTHVTHPQITANTNNVDIGSQVSVVRMTTDASRNITGITDGAINDPGEGRTLTIINVGSFNLVLVNQGAGSSAENRFALGANVTLTPDDGIALWYDVNDLRWRRRSTF